MPRPDAQPVGPMRFPLSPKRQGPIPRRTLRDEWGDIRRQVGLELPADPSRSEREPQ